MKLFSASLITLLLLCTAPAYAYSSFDTHGKTVTIDSLKEGYEVSCYVDANLVYQKIITADEGEGVTADEALKLEMLSLISSGECDVLLSEFLWIGNGVDITPEGGWIKPNIIKHGAR